MGSFLPDAQGQPPERGELDSVGQLSGAARARELVRRRRGVGRGDQRRPLHRPAVQVSQEDVSVFAAPRSGGEPRRQG